MAHNSSDKNAVFLVLLLYTNTVDFHSSNIYWLKCRFSELQIQFYKLNHWLKISFMTRFPFNSMINKYHLHPSSLYTLLISFILPSPLHSPHLPFIFLYPSLHWLQLPIILLLHLFHPPCPSLHPTSQAPPLWVFQGTPSWEKTPRCTWIYVTWSWNNLGSSGRNCKMLLRKIKISGICCLCCCHHQQTST